MSGMAQTTSDSILGVIRNYNEHIFVSPGSEAQAAVESSEKSCRA